MITIKRALTSKDIEDCVRFRHEVFVSEQRAAARSMRDLYDDTAVHVMALLDGRAIGTARAIFSPGGTAAVIGFVAVSRSYRQQGIGSKLIAALELAPEFCHIDTFLLNAGVDGVAFYRRLGYVPFGDAVMVGRTLHHRMKKIRPMPSSPATRQRPAFDEATAPCR